MKVRIASENFILAVRVLAASKAPKHVTCGNWVHVRNWIGCTGLYLSFSRTDLAWSAVLVIPCDVVEGIPRIEGASEAIVSIGFLKACIKQIPKNGADITFTAETIGTTVATFNGSVFGEPFVAAAEDFPHPPAIKEDGALVTAPVSSSELARAIEDVAFSMAKDICREQLQKVYLVSDHGRLFAVASDGKRIAESYVGRYDDARGVLNIGVPHTLVPSLVRLLKSRSVDVAIDVDEDSFLISALDETFSVICNRDRTRSGLPDYRSLIPEGRDCPEGFQCKAGDLVAAIKAAMTGHDRNAPPPIQITFRPGEALAEVKGSSTARLAADMVGGRDQFLWSAAFAREFAETRGKKERITFRTGAKGVRAVVAFGESNVRYAFMPVIPKTEDPA